jgi:hypothetical protein
MIDDDTHYARCAEMAETMLVVVPWDSPERPSVDLIAAWFAYLAGSTNERPT